MGSAIGAVVGGVGSLFGGKARRQEERDAQSQFDGAKANRDNFAFKNNYLGLENTAEDLTVNQNASNFQAQQTDSALSSGLDAIVQTGGGGGGAQAIANAALQSKQGISANIASQESANQQARVAQAAQNQQLEAQGADRVQNQRYDRIGNQLGESSQRLGAAKDARAKAKQDLIGGIAGVGSIVAGGLIGGEGFGANLQNNFGFGDGEAKRTPFDAATGKGSYKAYQNTGGTLGRGEFRQLFK